MKKLLLFTGAAYGIYMLIKSLNQKETANNSAQQDANTSDSAADSGQKRSSVKAHAHHGDIRGIMKKVSAGSHNLEQEPAV